MKPYSQTRLHYKTFLCSGAIFEKLEKVSNNIGLEGGQFLSSGIELNSTLTTIDMRLSGAGMEAEQAIAVKLKENSA